MISLKHSCHHLKVWHPNLTPTKQLMQWPQVRGFADDFPVSKSTWPRLATPRVGFQPAVGCKSWISGHFLCGRLRCRHNFECELCYTAVTRVPEPGFTAFLGCTQHSCNRRGQESWRLPLLVETQIFQWNWSLLVFTAQLLEVFHCPGFRIFIYDSSFSKALRVRTFPPTDRCTCSSNQVKLHTSTTRMARSNLGPGF